MRSPQPPGNRSIGNRSIRNRLSPTVVVATLLGLVTLLTACSGRYVITTTSGTKIVTGSKPKRVESRFTYRSLGGESNSISVLRVRSVEPYSKAAVGKQPHRPELQ